MFDLIVSGGLAVMPSRDRERRSRRCRRQDRGDRRTGRACRDRGRAHRRSRRADRHSGRDRPAYPLQFADPVSGAQRGPAECAAGPGQPRRPPWRDDDPHRFRPMPARPAIGAIDRGAPARMGRSVPLRLRLSPAAARQAVAGRARRAARGDPGRARLGQDVHHRHPPEPARPDGAVRRHLGGAEDPRRAGRSRRDPCRGQRHRHAHVRKADPRGPDGLREHGRGAQHLQRGPVVQPGDPAGRKCRGRRALHGPCLGRDRSCGDRRLAGARAFRSMARPCTSTCSTTPRTTSGRAGRCSIPTLAQIRQGPGGAVGGDPAWRDPGDRHRRGVLPAAGQAARPADRRHHRRQFGGRAAPLPDVHPHGRKPRLQPRRLRRTGVVERRADHGPLSEERGAGGRLRRRHRAARPARPQGFAQRGSARDRLHTLGGPSGRRLAEHDDPARQGRGRPGPVSSARRATASFWRARSAATSARARRSDFAPSGIFAAARHSSAPSNDPSRSRADRFLARSPRPSSSARPADRLNSAA